MSLVYELFPGKLIDVFGCLEKHIDEMQEIRIRVNRPVTIHINGCEKIISKEKLIHIYIPEELSYGYPWTRNGKIPVEKGTFINIRSFEKPYADYTGSFADNPFMFNFEISGI